MPEKLPLMERFFNKVKKTDNCWIWLGCKDKDGYGKFSYKKSNCKAHRVAYILLKKPIPKGKCILHLCDNRECVNPDHLRIGSHAENMKDMSLKGRASIGERAGNSKLTEAMIKAIRALYKTKLITTHRDLAFAFGVAHSQICYILNKKQWKHVE